MTLETVKDKMLDNIPLLMLGFFGFMYLGIYLEKRKVEKQLK